jgi:hypothetical protein
MLGVAIASSSDATAYFSNLFKLDEIDGLHGITESVDRLHILTGALSQLNFALPSDLELLGKLLVFLGNHEFEAKKECRHCVELCCVRVYKAEVISRVMQECSAVWDSPYSAAWGWFLATLLRVDIKSRADTQVSLIAELLIAEDPRIEVLLYSSRRKSMNSFKELNPRHDNDFPHDYRAISILPTVDELNDKNPRPVQKITSVDSQPLGDLLDRQFRYLREDFMQSLREGIKACAEDPISRHRNVTLTGVDLIGNRNICVITATVELNQATANKLTKLKDDERDDYIRERVLQSGHLIVLLDDDLEVVCCGQPFVKSKTKAYDAESKTLSFGISIDARSLNLCLLGRSDKMPLLAEYLHVSRASYDSQEPVMSRLQDISELPFHEELVNGQASLPSENPFIAAPESRCDPSQREAVHRASADRVSIVQGPPGTGKSMVGVQIAECLLRTNPDEKILCLCYTNHALDSFLESLLDTRGGAAGIKRLGNKKKISQKLLSYDSIYIEMKKGNESDQASKQRYGRTKEYLKEAENKLEYIKAFKPWGKKSFNQVCKFLIETPELLRQLQNGTADSGAGMVVVGAKGKRREADYAYQCWWAGDAAHPDLPDRSLSLWALSVSERRQQVYDSGKQRYELAVQAFADDWISCEQSADMLACLKEDENRLFKSQQLDDTCILGCTTSGAAKQFDLISSFRPTVLIVEEAAEILEAHILVNLCPSVKRLVMIGDHFQLRPKLDCWLLRKASKRGIDFDVSLFERLVASCDFPFPRTTLTVQHRMRPEFSRLLRETYPTLEDGQGVLAVPDVKGMLSNLCFVNHTNEEDRTASDDVATGNRGVFRNQYEAEMVVKTVQYLFQQGYTNEDIVILTPYLSQLQLIKKMLVNISDVIIDEKDLQNLGVAEAVELRKEMSMNTVSGIRVATVDNFQGEEANIIVSSLVRSNLIGKIGFLAERERVTVLLSRARLGFIMFGNADTLCSSPEGGRTWQHVINEIKKQRCFYGGLPTRCAKHPDSCSIMRRPDDFLNFAPSGGCTMPCDAEMEMCTHVPKHRCSKPCHPGDGNTVHAQQKCKEEMMGTCKAGQHSISRLCCSTRIPLCDEVISIPCSRGEHMIDKKCGGGGRSKCLVLREHQCSEGHKGAWGPCFIPADSVNCGICLAIANPVDASDGFIKIECLVSDDQNFNQWLRRENNKDIQRLDIELLPPFQSRLFPSVQGSNLTLLCPVDKPDLAEKAKAVSIGVLLELRKNVVKQIVPGVSLKLIEWLHGFFKILDDDSVIYFPDAGGVALYGRRDSVSTALARIRKCQSEETVEYEVDLTPLRRVGGCEDIANDFLQQLDTRIPFMTIVERNEWIMRGTVVGPINLSKIVEAQKEFIVRQQNSLPSSWGSASDTDPPPRLIELAKEDPEYLLASANFLTNFTANIVKIERVQNPGLYREYIKKKISIAEDNNGEPVEMLLKHGTSVSEPRYIWDSGRGGGVKSNAAGFDHRFGQQGMYGRGSYFAEDTKYSHRCFTFNTKVLDPTTNTPIFQMFLATVAAGIIQEKVGKYDKEWKLINMPEYPHHSIRGKVTDIEDALIVYELHQSYPKYLVSYTSNERRDRDN